MSGLALASALDMAIEGLRAGEPVILYDRPADAGHLMALGEEISAQTVTAMILLGGGNLAVALPPERCAGLELRAMPSTRSALATIEAATGVTTGISAPDRARTITLAASPDSGPGDLISPGHVIPLRTRAGGLLERAGRAEAAVDAAAMAGAVRAAALCEVLDDAGDLAGLDYLVELAVRADLAIIGIDELREARAEQEWRSW